MRLWRAILMAGLAFGLTLAGCTTADDKNAGIVPTGKGLAINEAEANGRMEVVSPDLESGKPIPEQFSNYGANKPPRLMVSGAPEKTVSYALIVEDPDAPDGPFVHWVAYDIPPVDFAAGTALSASAITGANSAGTSDYFGPRPPQGNKPHHYHFQIFALNKKLDLKPGATRDELVNAFRNSVLAKGELIATYQKQ